MDDNATPQQSEQSESGIRHPPPPGDRDLLLAIMNAVCTLTEHITGKRMILKIGNGEGDVYCQYCTPFKMQEIIGAAPTLEQQRSLGSGVRGHP